MIKQDRSSNEESGGNSRVLKIKIQKIKLKENFKLDFHLYDNV